MIKETGISNKFYKQIDANRQNGESKNKLLFHIKYYWSIVPVLSCI
jgi:hypothetical protein